MAMTSQEQAIADDFERGWSDERIKAATVTRGPYAFMLDLAQSFPQKDLEALANRAQTKGTTQLNLIIKAVQKY